MVSKIRWMLILLSFFSIFPSVQSFGRRKTYAALEDEEESEKRKRKVYVDSNKNSDDWLSRLNIAMGNHKFSGLIEDEKQHEENSEYEGLFEKWSKFYASLFVMDPPKDFYHGLLAGIMNIWKGYMTGIEVVLSYPYNLGAKNLLSLPKNLFFSAWSSLWIMTGGVLTGFRQMLWGFKSTPAAMRARKAGQRWNYDTFTWDYFSLHQESQQIQLLLQKRQPKQNQQLRTYRKRVKDLTYYQKLQVRPDASSHEIKQAYYKLALTLHPDKNKNDDNNIQFQELSTIYQTLSDAKKRLIYDTMGICHMQQQQEEEIIDPYVFFAVMFGSFLVEPYVGQLAIASVVTNLIQIPSVILDNDEISSPTNSNFNLLQRKRQLDIALHLQKRTDNFVKGIESLEQFQSSCQNEAMAIAQEGEFGIIFLKVIGSSLIEESELFLKGGTTSMVKHTFTQLTRKLSTSVALWNTVRTSIASVVVWQYIESQFERENGTGSNECNHDHLNKKKTRNDKKFVSKLEKSLPSILKLAWAYNIQDISKTLHEACSKLYAHRDHPDDDLNLRIKRSESVRILGTKFLEVSKTQGHHVKNNDPNKKIKQRLREAYIASKVIFEE